MALIRSLVGLIQIVLLEGQHPESLTRVESLGSLSLLISRAHG